MFNKLLFVTLVLLVVSAQAVELSDSKVEDILKNIRQTSQPVHVDDAKANLEEFIKGYLNGVGSAPVFSVIKPCIQYDEQILKDLAQAAVALKSHDPAEVKKGIKLIGEAAKIVPVAAAYCAATGFDIERVIKMIQAFSNPAQFAFIAGRNILINHVEVYREIKALVEAVENKNFNLIGYWSARAMVTVLIGSAPATFDTKADLQLFAKGFLKGIESDSFFDEIKTCINDDKEIYQDLKSGIELIRSKDAGKVKEGIKLVGQAVQLIPQAARVCGVAEKRIEKLVTLIKSFTDPKSFFFYVGKSILINRVEVFHEVQGAIEAYVDKNFTGTGFWTGKAMATIFLHQSFEVLDTKTDLQNFAKGFLKGIASDSFFDEIKTCINDDKEIYFDLKQGIELIRSKDAGKVKEGIKLVGQAVQLIPQAARACGVAEQRIEKLVKLIKSFTDPKSFFFYVGKSILINRVEVFNEVKGAVEAYQNKDFNGVGFYVGKAMATIFLHESSVETLDTKTDLQNFAKGFLKGIASDSFFDEIKTCINDDKEIYFDLKQGIELIRSKDAGKVKEGIKLVGQAVQLIPQAARACGVAEQRIEKLVKLIRSFTDPKSFFFYVGKSILINRVEVFNEVKGAVEAYQNKDFNGVGFYVGKAMATIFLHESSVETLDTKTDLQNFAKGFLKGIESDSFFDEIKTCINDDKEIYQDLKSGIELIRSKDAGKVKEGIKLIGQAVQLIPQAARACGIAEKRIEKLVTLIKSFTSPKSFFFYVGKSILINRVEVFHEVQGALQAYADKDFNGVGFWTGKAMATIFLHQSFEVLDTKTDLQNFAKGFLQGVASDSFFDEIKTCIADDKEIFYDLKTGIELIRSKDAGKVKEGVQLVGKAVQLIPQAARICGVAEKRIEKLVTLIKSFTDPKSFFFYVGKSLLINRVEVFHEVQGAVEAYQNKNFTGTGFYVGKAMATIFLHETFAALDAKADLQLFAKGFLKGIESDSFFDEIKTCIADDQEIANDLRSGIELIRTKEAAKVKEGIKLVGTAVQLIPNAAKVCGVAEEKIQKIVKLIKSFTDPKSFVYYVGKSILINRVEVFGDIQHAVEAYVDKDLTNTGFYTGKAMATIFLHNYIAGDFETQVGFLAK